ncbi:MAG: Dyp-type peroxidase [Candidatus Eremiobacteraeota bacterium]|nr:Dyp-type peroxidase [Candidatus Eremiobacteraeota bacterium]
MSVPQIGIFALGDGSHSFLEFALRENVRPEAVIRCVADLHGPRTTVDAVNLVAGLRPELWRTVAPADVPPDVTSFERPLVGLDGYTMPATQADIFTWVAGASYDIVFDAATSIADSLLPVATIERELTGWIYQKNRDLTGFQDGTKNPSLIDAPGIALIADGLPGAGGSVLLLQQWKHHTDQWRGLPVGTQEQVIGRTKTDSIEFPEDRMPADSHVSRTTLEERGIELDIFRRNTAYGSVSDHGTMFVGFAKDQHRLARMLERMAGVGDGVRDALTRYTTPLTGAYYFIPALSSLNGFASPAA